jgi:hypothetical protein
VLPTFVPMQYRSAVLSCLKGRSSSLILSKALEDLASVRGIDHGPLLLSRCASPRNKLSEYPRAMPLSRSKLSEWGLTFGRYCWLLPKSKHFCEHSLGDCFRTCRGTASALREVSCNVAVRRLQAVFSASLLPITCGPKIYFGGI